MNSSLARPRYLPPALADASPAPAGKGPWGEIYRRLFDRWGDPYWWPGADAWEVAVGAILTQNTAWTNVERALAALRERGWTSPGDLLRADTEQLAEAIRPSGYFNAKARKLRVLASWWRERAEAKQAQALAADELRAELLELWGVGPETADAIACYAFGQPLFVVDAYTRRMVQRLRGLPTAPGYDELQQEIHQELPADVLLLNFLHGLIVVLGKEHCTARAPRCADCPLLDICEYGRHAVQGQESRP